MEPTEYFDRYSPHKPANPAENAENTGNITESGNPAASEAPGTPETPAPSESGTPESAEAAADPMPPSYGNPRDFGYSGEPVNPPVQTDLSYEQLGYGGPRISRGKNLALAIGKAIGYFAVYFGIELIIANIFSLIWSAQIADSAGSAEEAQQLYEELWNARSMMLMIVVDVVFLAAVALIFYLRRGSSLSVRQNLGLKNPVPLGKLGMIFGIGVTLNYAITLPLGWLTQLLPEETVNDYAETQAVYDGGGLFIFIISGVILAPIVEELVFRGLISTRLSRAMPAWVAVLIAAAGFGALHGTLIQGVYAGLLGVLLGAVFFREDSLIASVVLHFGFNLASLLPYVLSMDEALAESPSVNALYGNLCLICIPVSIVLLIYYFIVVKKKAPADPGAPGVNGWLMKE